MASDNWPIGLTITDVRDMTKQEAEVEGWDEFDTRDVTVLVLSDGSKLYPSRDPEGNGGGALFGVDPDGKNVLVYMANEASATDTARGTE